MTSSYSIFIRVQALLSLSHSPCSITLQTKIMPASQALSFTKASLIVSVSGILPISTSMLLSNIASISDSKLTKKAED
ncbi:hypothetical protein [Glaciecola punicea]|uniref:hypothetical protein n=1 Tax=Glaciecola punicea TaxID=56804 RepID=UPI001495BAEE|nr:hypothetical protein [Glaciecola punicea]